MISSPTPIYAPLPLFSSLSSTSSSSSSSSSQGRVSKRGRKPKPWTDVRHNIQYVKAAISDKDKHKRLNNVSSGKYRKKQQDRKAQLELEAVIEETNKQRLNRIVKKNEKKIMALKEMLSSLSSNATFFQFNSQ